MFFIIYVNKVFDKSLILILCNDNILDKLSIRIINITELSECFYTLCRIINNMYNYFFLITDNKI